MLAGGGDTDFYAYFAGDGAFGQDTIKDSLIPSDSSISTGNFIRTIAFSDALTINLVADPGQPEVKGTSTASPGTINWSGNVIDNVINTSQGNDTVDGNAAGNFIFSEVGTDTVRGGGGDDFIDVQDGSGGDRVDCGDGTDTVDFDNTDLVNIVDCEA